MKNKIAILIATWFYSGLIPPLAFKGMAGTYGSFFSIPLVFGALWLSNNVFQGFYVVIVLIIVMMCLWSVPRAQIILGPKIDWKGKIKTRDQNQIVIDETLGMLIACYNLPTSDQLFWLLLGFVFFRFFDIAKIPPARYFDKIKNVAGVMLDDVVSGIYAYASIQIFIFLFN